MASDPEYARREPSRLGGGRAPPSPLWGSATWGSTNSALGGEANLATGNDSMVGGGADNTASGDNAVVRGGEKNVAAGTCSTVPGGRGNTARGACPYAAGSNANDAGFDECYVWNDGTPGAAPTGPKQYIVHFSGGACFSTGNEVLRARLGGGTGPGPRPTASAGPGPCTAILAANSTDTAGMVALSPSDRHTTGRDFLLRITFGATYTTPPFVSLTPASEASASLTGTSAPFVVATNEGFEVRNGGGALPPNMHVWHYHVIK